MEVGLKVLSGSKAGQTITLPTPLCLVGRAKECHLRSGQAAVSQRHCVFTVRGNELVLCDLQSLNGTYVNGERAEGEIVLQGGDKVRIGPLTFEVMIRVRPESHSQEPATEGFGTAGGNANLSTMVVEHSRKQRPDSDLEVAPLPDDGALTVSEEGELLTPGQTVVVMGGLLQGARGLIVKQVAGGYLISLLGQGGQVWAKIPASLLRAE